MSQEAEVFHKLRVATPLSSRTGHPVSLIFNGVNANSWLSPIGIESPKKSNRQSHSGRINRTKEEFVSQRPQTAGSIVIIRHHPKASGLKKDELVSGKHLPGKCEGGSNNTATYGFDSFKRPQAFEDGYHSPINSTMFNQRVKKAYKGGGFCDGPSRIPRPHTSKSVLIRSSRDQPINLELTVKSLEQKKSRPFSCMVRRRVENEDNEHKSLNADAFEDLSKSCVRRSKSAPPGARDSDRCKTPSLYWRAKSAYHRRLMTPNPEQDSDTENTQIPRGSMLRPLMYSSNCDIQHSAGCPYRCKGCFKACLASPDYLEKARNRRFPVNVRRDIRQRTIMKKDPRYILHQALARNQPIYKLVHGIHDERCVRKAWVKDTVVCKDVSDKGSSSGETTQTIETKKVNEQEEAADVSMEEYKAGDEKVPTVIVSPRSRDVVSKDQRVKSAEPYREQRRGILAKRPQSCPDAYKNRTKSAGTDVSKTTSVKFAMPNRKSIDNNGMLTATDTNKSAETTVKKIQDIDGSKGVEIKRQQSTGESGNDVADLKSRSEDDGKSTSISNSTADEQSRISSGTAGSIHRNRIKKKYKVKRDESYESTDSGTLTDDSERTITHTRASSPEKTDRTENSLTTSDSNVSPRNVQEKKTKSKRRLYKSAKKRRQQSMPDSSSVEKRSDKNDDNVRSRSGSVHSEVPSETESELQFDTAYSETFEKVSTEDDDEGADSNSDKEDNDKSDTGDEDEDDEEGDNNEDEESDGSDEDSGKLESDEGKVTETDDTENNENFSDVDEKDVTQTDSDKGKEDAESPTKRPRKNEQRQAAVGENASVRRRKKSCKKSKRLRSDSNSSTSKSDNSGNRTESSDEQNSSDSNNDTEENKRSSKKQNKGKPKAGSNTQRKKRRQYASKVKSFNKTVDKITTEEEDHDPEHNEQESSDESEESTESDVSCGSEHSGARGKQNQKKNVSKGKGSRKPTNKQKKPMNKRNQQKCKKSKPENIASKKHVISCSDTSSSECEEAESDHKTIKKTKRQVLKRGKSRENKKSKKNGKKKVSKHAENSDDDVSEDGTNEETSSDGEDGIEDDSGGDSATSSGNESRGEIGNTKDQSDNEDTVVDDDDDNDCDNNAEDVSGDGVSSVEDDEKRDELDNGNDIDDSEESGENINDESENDDDEDDDDSDSGSSDDDEEESDDGDESEDTDDE